MCKKKRVHEFAFVLARYNRGSPEEDKEFIRIFATFTKQLFEASGFGIIIEICIM